MQNKYCSGDQLHWLRIITDNHSDITWISGCKNRQYDYLLDFMTLKSLIRINFNTKSEKEKIYYNLYLNDLNTFATGDEVRS